MHFMNKLFRLLVMAFVCTGNTYAGVTVLNPGDKAMHDKREKLINDAVCGSFLNRLIDVSKSPYFTDEYKYANIKLTNGRVLERVKMRIDLVIQQTYFISSNDIEINIDPGMAKEITYSDTTPTGIIFYKFQTHTTSIL